MDDNFSDDLDAGYNDIETLTTTPEVKEVSIEPDAPKLVQLTEEQYNSLMGLTTAIDQIKAESKRQSDTVFGHLGGLKQSLSALQEMTKNIVDKPTQTQVNDAISDPEEWAQLKNDFPEWALATERLLDSKLGAQKQFDEHAFVEHVMKQVEGKTVKIREEIIDDALDTILPNWVQEINTPEFNSWMSTQPDDVKALANSDRMRDAASMLNKYNSFKTEQKRQQENTAKVAKSRENRIAAAVTPRGSGGHPTGSTLEDDFEAGYNS